MFMRFPCKAIFLLFTLSKSILGFYPLLLHRPASLWLLAQFTSLPQHPSHRAFGHASPTSPYIAFLETHSFHSPIEKLGLTPYAAKWFYL